ncbi:MAG: hypothetical protein HQL85_09965 [Magnetococcales bacterium]|nr:hypothetical protein [Magnetococcales bacterium]
MKEKRGLKGLSQGFDFKSKAPIFAFDFVFDLKKQSQKHRMETFSFKFKNKVNTLGAIP